MSLEDLKWQAHTRWHRHGHTQKQIAEDMRRSQATVNGWIRDVDDRILERSRRRAMALLWTDLGAAADLTPKTYRDKLEAARLLVGLTEGR